MKRATVLLLLMAGPLWAARAPQMLRLQGRFTDSQAAPLTDVLPVRFSVWDSPDGYGNLLWQDVQNVSIQNNTFQVVLGRATPLPPAVFNGNDRWLEMQIRDDAPLRPRHRIPYQAIQAQVAAPPAVPELTPEEKRQLELQIERYKEEVVEPKPEPAPAPVPVVKPPVVQVPAPHPKPHRKPPVRASAPAPAPVEKGELGTFYTVQAGDTLRSIAGKLYGNAELWYDLYYLNRDRLGPMGHLFAGQILVLPIQAPGVRSK